MAKSQQSQRNRLLQKLTPDDFALLSPHLADLPLPRRFSMEEPNKPIKHVYFLDSGIASIVTPGMSDKDIEIGVIGCEGMTGLPVILGNDRSPNETYVQIAGVGQQLPVPALRQAMDESKSLRSFLLRYAQAFMTQTAHTAVANARGRLHERLARWLLLAHDRVPGKEIPLTHEFLSMMLGVRRAGVTVALNDLKERRLIQAQRSEIEILDRKGMEKLAGPYYGVPEAEYDRLMG